MVDKFKFDSNFRPETAFTRIRFGHDSPLLETELNEMQIIQERNRSSLIRRLVPSGFVELVKKEFSGPAIICNPVENSMSKLNHIAMAPARVIINGYELTLDGNFAIDNYTNYILINLTESPEIGYREDLVYLEVWFQILTGSDDIKRWGYQNGQYLGQTIIDPRVQQETSRRIALCWDVRVAQNINFKKFSNGFGINNASDYSPIRAIADGRITANHDFELVFANAGSDYFKDCDFYKDNNLWVAGRPNYSIGNTNIYGKYIFALPLFKIKRRNKSKYTIENFNGSFSLNEYEAITDSYIDGDLNNNVRPDKLYHDYIVDQDLVDLRKTISVKEYKSEYYMNKSLKDLFTGKLQTFDTKQARRVQFGNAKPDYTANSLVYVNKFNKTLTPIKPVVADPYLLSGDSDIVYKDSIGGYGVHLDGSTSINYKLENLDVNQGTIDFYLQPYWHGSNDVSQKILSIMDSATNTDIFTFNKVGTKLIFKQFYDINNLASNEIQIDLTTNLILAKNIYHIRLSWSNSSQINAAFLYINGKLYGQTQYVATRLNPNRLVIGAVETITDGFVIEDLLIYNRSFEIVNLNQQIQNDVWPNLPKDLTNGNSLLFPSFNSILSNFGDNDYIQKNTIVKLSTTIADLETGARQATLNVPNGKLIDSSSGKSPRVYDTTGTVIYDSTSGVYNGEWSGLDTSTAVFSTTVEVDEIVVQYDLVIPAGNGGYDLPSEILAAGLHAKQQVIENGSYVTKDVIKEISFDRKSNTSGRQVNYIKPRRVNNELDKAYDYSIAGRTEKDCFARVLYYNINGNGRNDNYSIPAKLYGYDVIGVLSANKKIKRIQFIEDEVIPANNKYAIELNTMVLTGEIIQFKLALGGITFDYDTSSKTLITNIHKTKMLEFIANGNDLNYTIPCFNNNDGGILKSVLTYTEDNVNYKNVYYLNDELFPLDELNGERFLATYALQSDSIETPFLKITFDKKPAFGQVIRIPVLVSYQPNEDEVISIWYNYTPYQGCLSNTPKNLRRISDWKYFITTLSSGNVSLNVEESNVNSLNNIVNRLPGGLSYSYVIDGQPIKLKHMADTLVKSDLNSQLIFTNDAYFASDNNELDDSFFMLDSDFTVYKKAVGFQDGELVIQDKDFKLYFPNITDPITKYSGMACLVLDENGEILLFVVGSLNNKTASITNELTPEYGDLFKIPGLPTTIKQY